MTLDEIDQALDSKTPAALLIWEKIGRDSSMYTTALFAVSTSPNGDILELAGTGTLVAVGDSHYILTARHVWEEVLRPANKIGISLRENLNHKCLMDTDSIVPFGPPKPAKWNEWGPDIVFLRIPPIRVLEIEAFRVFYRLRAEEKPLPAKECIEAGLLIGTPHALGKFTQNHASVEIHGFWSKKQSVFNASDFEYIDLDVELPQPSTAKSFGGVSGGGVWRVFIYSNPSTGEIDSDAVLQGIAFYEFNVQKGQGTIRCHGLRSILPVISSL